MTDQEQKHLHALNTIYGLGAQKMRALLALCGSPEAVWQAPLEKLLASGIGPALAEKIALQRKTIDIEKEWQKLEQENILLATWEDPFYPPLLREILNPPFLIYMRGDTTKLKLRSVAVVGSRAHTPYGKQAAYALAQDLAKAGLAVVSGLALGIDAIAHRAALDVGGATIAVLGNSLDNASINPKSNFQLAQEILAKGGLLISEYPPATAPTQGSFPARNRIMAGISGGTLVVEAAPESGSLITANLALEFNRDVYAVPGSIFAQQSLGTNKLIKSGAKMVTCAQDILEEFSLAEAAQKTTPANDLSGFTDAEKSVFQLLSCEPLHIDRIIKLSKLETSTAISTLSFLEMKGVAKNIGGQNYVKP